LPLFSGGVRVVGFTHAPEQALLINAGPNVWPIGLGGRAAYQPVHCQMGSLVFWAPWPVDKDTGFGNACASICSANSDVKIKAHTSKNSFIIIQLEGAAYKYTITYFVTIILSA
jgi:hypothetical protein